MILALTLLFNYALSYQLSASLSVKEFLEKAKEDFEEKWKNPSKVSSQCAVSLVCCRGAG